MEKKIKKLLDELTIYNNKKCKSPISDSIERWRYHESKRHMSNLESILEIPAEKLTDKMYQDYYNASIFIKEN